MFINIYLCVLSATKSLNAFLRKDKKESVHIFAQPHGKNTAFFRMKSGVV